MSDKLVNITEFGTVQVHELGFECDDQRGRQDDAVVNRLFPQSVSGGGQSLQNYVVNRYRPGNRYRFIRCNGTIVQFSCVKFDVTFATEGQRHANVINTAAAAVLGNSIDGILEFGDGGPLSADPAATSHAAGVFGFMTTRGMAIGRCNVAVVADDLLAADSSSAGQMSAIAVTTPTAPETVRIANLAAGKGIKALTGEPATGFKAGLALVYLN